MWKDACAVALIHKELCSGAFEPAKGNVLLVGDAAGLILPIMFEGIGTALKSGILAADSVIAGMDKGGDASSIYLKGLQPIRECISSLVGRQEMLAAASERGPDILADSLVAAYLETLIIQEE
ncbi:NAD(P)/FAD-dependent oxidoreductase [Thermodesulfobacteriota bacterium]